MKSMYNPPHPGEILREGYLIPMGLNITHTAKKLCITRNNLSNIVNEKTGISAEMACRLAIAFNTTPEFWLNMQQQYDLWQTKQKTNFDDIEVILNAS